jgi:hypothetical protein
MKKIIAVLALSLLVFEISAQGILTGNKTDWSVIRTTINENFDTVYKNVDSLKTITNSSINWDSAYTHSQIVTGNPHVIGYADISDFNTGVSTFETSHSSVLVDTDFSTSGLMKTNGAGVYSIITDNTSNWNTSYSWGNHSGLYVGLTGNETIAGIKTFSSFPLTPSSAPTSDYQAANKKYVDDNAGSQIKGYYHESAGTENGLFDAIKNDIPNVGDEILITGAAEDGLTKQYYVSRATRESATVIYLKALTDAGLAANLVIVDGSSDAVKASLAW